MELSNRVVIKSMGQEVAGVVKSAQNFECKHRSLLIDAKDFSFRCLECGEGHVTIDVDITGGSWKGYSGTAKGFSGADQKYVLIDQPYRGRIESIRVKPENVSFDGRMIELEILDLGGAVGNAKVGETLWGYGRYSDNSRRPTYRFFIVRERHTDTLKVEEVELSNGETKYTGSFKNISRPDGSEIVEHNRNAMSLYTESFRRGMYDEETDSRPATISEMMEYNQVTKSIENEAEAAKKAARDEQWEKAAAILRTGWDSRTQMPNAEHLTTLTVITERYGAVPIAYSIDTSEDMHYNRQTGEDEPVTVFEAELIYWTREVSKINPETREVEKYRTQAHNPSGCRGKSEFDAVCRAIYSWMI